MGDVLVLKGGTGSDFGDSDWGCNDDESDDGGEQRTQNKGEGRGGRVWLMMMALGVTQKATKRQKGRGGRVSGCGGNDKGESPQALLFPSHLLTAYKDLGCPWEK